VVLMKPIVVKMGGSVITDKMVPFKIRDDVISRMASEISRAERTDVVIVHGGGSVGHYLAKRLNLLGSDEPKKINVSYVLSEMDKLSTRIVSHLVDKGIPAVAIPTHAIGSHDSAGSLKLDESVVRLALRSGLSPVLRGDVILGEKKIDIVSGDLLSSRLAVSLGAERLIFCMDQEGIIGTDGKLMPRVRLSEPYDHLLWPSEEGRTDVTGGLGAKLKEIESVVKAGIPVLFLSPFRENRLLNAMTGKPFRGTEVIP